MHHVDAKIARPRYAREGVHVGAVHVKLRAALVQDGGNFLNALLEDAQGVGIRKHQRGDVIGGKFAQMVRVDLAARVRADVLHLVSGDHHGRGVRAVRGIGDQDFLAGVTLIFEIRPDH